MHHNNWYRLYCKNEVHHEQSNRYIYLDEDIWCKISTIHSILDRLNRGFLYWSYFFSSILQTEIFRWYYRNMSLKYRIICLLLLKCTRTRKKEKRRERNRYYKYIYFTIDYINCSKNMKTSINWRFETIFFAKTFIMALLMTLLIKNY